MASLENIFDSPTPPRQVRTAQPLSSPASPVAPTRRNTQPALFDTYSSASESDHAGPSRKRKEAPKKTNRNAAAAEATRRAIAAIEDGSDIEDTPVDAAVTLDPMAGMSGTAAGDDEEGAAKKPRRVMPKIDPERLLGPQGFSLLVKQAYQFKVKGKGQEAKDLRNLMNVYQLWAHQMYPRATFRDTVGRVENVCKARRMDVALSGIIDAMRPREPSVDPEGMDNPTVEERRDVASPSGRDSTARRLFEPAPASRSPSPIRRPIEDDDDGGPSIEELMAMEEEQAGWDAMEDMENGDEPARSTTTAAPAPAPAPEVEDDEYDDLYD